MYIHVPHLLYKRKVLFSVYTHLIICTHCYRVYMSPLLVQLAELLGFSQLDLIQELLTHRQEVVASALDNSALLLTRGKSWRHFHVYTFY